MNRAPVPAPDFEAAEAFAWHTEPDRLDPVARVAGHAGQLVVGKLATAHGTAVVAAKISGRLRSLLAADSSPFMAPRRRAMGASPWRSGVPAAAEGSRSSFAGGRTVRPRSQLESPSTAGSGEE